MVRYWYAYCYDSYGANYFRFIFQDERDLWINTWKKVNVRIYSLANTEVERHLNNIPEARNIFEFDDELLDRFRASIKLIESGKYKSAIEYLISDIK